MKVDEKKLENGQVRMEALASPAEVNHAFAVAKQQFLRKMKIAPAAGKTADQLAAEQLGITNLVEIVAQQAAEYMVPFALDKHGFIPAFMPKGSFETLPLPNKPYEFSVVATAKPTYELSSYEPVEFSFEEIEIPSQAIEDQIKTLTESRAEFVSVDDREVRAGDNIIIAMSGERKGEKLAALEADGRRFVVGMNLISKSFDENVIGMKCGEEKTFMLIQDEPENAPQVADQTPIQVTVKVKEILEKRIPELTDKWVAEQFPQLPGIEALVESIKQTLLVQAEEKEKKLKVELAVEAATKRFEGELDEDILIETKRALIENTCNTVQSQGMTFEFYVEQQGGEQAFARKMTRQATEILVRGYTLDAVFRHFRLKVTDQDVKETCQEMNMGDAKTALRMMEDNGQGFLLREASERHAASKYLLENAIVTIIE